MYEEEFGEAPPQRIWPSVKERFRNVDRFKRINTAEHFVVSRRTIFYGLTGIGMFFFASSAHAESSFTDAILVVLCLVIGIPALIWIVLWLTGRSKKNGGCAGGGCGGCGGCGG